MKKSLFSILLSLVMVQLFAQSEDYKHEISLVLIDMDIVVNSQNRSSTFLLGTGLVYSYQLNDLLHLQTGVSSYETNVRDNCRFCFNNLGDGEGYYTNREFRLGLKVEKPSVKENGCAWFVGGMLKYGRADYRAVFIRETFSFDPVTFEPIEVNIRTNRDITTRYISAGLDIGFKFHPSKHVFVELVSNAGVFTEFNVDNRISAGNGNFNTFRLSGNALEIRTGIQF